MFFRIFSGNKLRRFFEEKWKMLMNKKIVDIQDTSFQQLKNKIIKLKTNNAIIFSQLLPLLIRVILI